MTDQHYPAADFPEPPFGHRLAYAVGFFPAGLLSGLMGAWLMYYYCLPPDAGLTGYLAPSMFGLLMFLLNIPSAFADPTVGFLSDRTRSRLGRRLPFILFGTPIMALFFVLLWFPPARGNEPLNAIWLVATVLVYFLSFTVVVNPYLAIMPEVWQSVKGRMSVSSLMSVTQGVGMLLGMAIGPLITRIPHYLVGGVELNGYRVTALAAGVLTIVAFLPTLLWIRERPHSTKKEVPFNFVRSGWETLKNPAFLPYLISVALINTATTMIIAMMPYQVKVLAGGSEEITSALLGGLMVLAMLLLPVVNILVDRVPRRTLYLVCCGGMAVIISLLYFAGHTAFLSPLPFMIAVLVLSAPFVSVFLVVPRTLLADVMDFDEQRTGYRREAMYNGMESLIGKLPVGLAPWIMGMLFTRFGDSIRQPMGIRLSAVAAGVLTFAGLVAFLFYPLRK
jgi:GPH family glycoside/pentoside/hexuronide:cation symporter